VETRRKETRLLPSTISADGGPVADLT